MKAIALFFLYSLSLSAHTPSLADDYAALAHSLAQMPPAMRIAMAEALNRLKTTQTDPALLAESIHALRCGIERAEKRGYNPYLALNALQNGSNAGSLAPVWQALMYCGGLCCIYLFIVAVQDYNARAIINGEDKNKTWQKRSTLQKKLIQATNALIDFRQTSSKPKPPSSEMPE